MENRKLSISKMLGLLGCLAVDIAILVAFTEIFSFFSILSPVKSVLMLLTLLSGLFISNVAILFPALIYKRIGVANSAVIIVVSIAYAIVSNLFSMLLVYGSIIWYLIWELIIFSAWLASFSVIAFFSKRSAADYERDEFEKESKTLIKLELMGIEETIASRGNNSDTMLVTEAFKALKERINVSTPFGRAVGNSAVTEMENRIRDNLTDLHNRLKTGGNVADIKILIENTRKLVMNREAMNIR